VFEEEFVTALSFVTLFASPSSQPKAELEGERGHDLQTFRLEGVA
jgi:hypothetical protein